MTDQEAKIAALRQISSLILEAVHEGIIGEDCPETDAKLVRSAALRHVEMIEYALGKLTAVPDVQKVPK